MCIKSRAKGDVVTSNSIKMSTLAASVRDMQSTRLEAGRSLYDTAVILHLYYPELWDEIKSYLNSLGSSFDLFVSVPNAMDSSINKLIKQSYPDAFVCSFENLGRDIGPFMEIYPVIAAHYQYICKIHSKKSLHLVDGSKWRDELFTSLLGSSSRVAEIKLFFNRFPNIGIIAPEGQLLLCEKNLDINTEKIAEISKKLGVNDLDKFEFPAGSMFWFKSSALIPLLSLNVNQADFDSESGQVDGTLAHAIERAFALASIVAGYVIVDTQIIKIYKELCAEGFNRKCVDSKRDDVVIPVLLRIASNERTIARLKQSIVEMECSYSWRITRPLRAVIRQIVLKTWLRKYFNTRRNRKIEGLV